MATPSIPSAYRKRLALTLVGTFVLVPAAVSWSVNRWLDAHRGELVASLEARLETPLKIGRVHYGFWTGLWLEDFRLADVDDPAFPSPVSIARVQVRPSVSWYPPLGLQLGWRITFHSPRLTLKARLQEILRMSRYLGSSPEAEKRWGPFRVRARLVSLEGRDGSVKLVSPSQEPWKQEFEGVRILLGRQLWRGERLVISGHVAGRPESTFRIRGAMRDSSTKTVDTEMGFECRNLAGAQLAPHLGATLRLPADEVTANLRIKNVRGRGFWSEGRLVFPRAAGGRNIFRRLFGKHAPQFRYRVKGELAPGICRLPSISMTVGGVEVTGSGGIVLAGERSSYRMRLVSGDIPLRKLKSLAQGLQVESGVARAVVVVTGSARHVSPYVSLLLDNCLLTDTTRGIRISKLGGRLRLTKDRIAIEEVWAFLDNLPFRCNGSIQRLRQPKIRLDVSTYPGQVPSLRPRNPLNLEARFEAQMARGRWSGSVAARHRYYEAGSLRQDLWSLTADGFEIEPRAVLSDEFIKGSRVRSRALVLRHQGWRHAFEFLTLRNATFFLAGEPPALRVDLLEGAFAGGTLRGRFTVDGRRFPDLSWKLSGSLALAQAESLLRQMGLSYPLTGTLSADGQAGTDGAFSVAGGRFRITDGRLGPVPALESLAAETGIEPLRRLDFREISGTAAWKPDGQLHLSGLKLRADQAHMNADFRIRGDRMAGTLSARFPESALQASSQLRWLLHYVGGRDWIDFDFKFAGTLAAPRVQWLTGEFKRKVETRLFPWLRNQLAQEIERRLGTAA
jgi:hypothetical protein